MSAINSNLQSFAAAQTSTAQTVSNPAASTDMTGLADFNDRAGIGRFVHGHEHAHKTMAQRRLMQMRRRTPAQAAPNNVDTNEDGEENSSLHAAASRAVSALQRSGKSELESLLEQYDALERHSLLRAARAEVNKKDLDPDEKNGLKDTLNEMMSDLMDQYGDVIRSGLKDAHALDAAMMAMNELSAANNPNHDSQSLRELRALYSEKSDGKLEEPLTSLTLAKKLQEKFGTANFSSALANIRSKMAGDLRNNPPKSISPKMWLSLSDAASFNTVQTSFSLAGDLRRELSQRGGIIPKADQAEAAVALLGVAEPGGKAEKLMSEIVEREGINAFQQAQACLLLRQTVGKLPLTMWSQERMPQRLDLLDELKKLMFEADKDLPHAKSPEEQMEERLWGIHRKKKRDQGDGNQGGGEKNDEEDQEKSKAEA